MRLKLNLPLRFKTNNSNKTRKRSIVVLSLFSQKGAAWCGGVPSIVSPISLTIDPLPVAHDSELLFGGV